MTNNIPPIRLAGVDDVAVAATLFDAYRQFYGQPSDLELAQRFLRQRLEAGESMVFLALDAAGRALGFTQLFPSFSSVSAARIFILNDLFVLPEARGRGVGKALLDAARHHARDRGAIRLELSTARDNPARHLYEAVGYVLDTEFLHYSQPV